MTEREEILQSYRYAKNRKSQFRIICELYAKSPNDVADIIGRDQCIADGIKLPKQKEPSGWTDAHKKFASKLIADGFSSDEIHQAILETDGLENVSCGCVFTMTKEEYRSSKRKKRNVANLKWTAAHEAFASKMFIEGFSLKDIHRAMLQNNALENVGYQVLTRMARKGKKENPQMWPQRMTKKWTPKHDELLLELMEHETNAAEIHRKMTAVLDYVSYSYVTMKARENRRDKMQKNRCVRIRRCNPWYEESNEQLG